MHVLDFFESVFKDVSFLVYNGCLLDISSSVALDTFFSYFLFSYLEPLFVVASL